MNRSKREARWKELDDFTQHAVLVSINFKEIASIPDLTRENLADE